LDEEEEGEAGRRRQDQEVVRGQLRRVVQMVVHNSQFGHGSHSGLQYF